MDADGRFLAVLAASLVLVGAPVALFGQGGGQDTVEEAKHEVGCRLAHQILTKGQPAVNREWALGVISACPGLADVLPHLWRDPPTEERELEKLFQLSRRVSDGDVFAAALEVASSPSRSSTPRIAALGVLASYLRPELILDFDGLEPLEEFGPIEWNNVWGLGADLSPQEQGDPLPCDYETTTRQLVHQLSQRAEDAKVRAAAWWLVTLRGLGTSTG